MQKNNKKEKNIFYLRTDIGSHDLKAGGSVAHTQGVIEGFLSLGCNVLCASSAMHSLLKKCSLDDLYLLKEPSYLSCIGFRLNCLASNVFFTFGCLKFLKRKKIDVVYQRYSLLNFVGALISWIKKVPFVLEFNGSEVWIDKNWQSKGWMRIRFIIRWIENFNLKKADTVVVVSQVLKDMLVQQGIHANKILVNPNGVDTVRFDSACLVDARKDIRKKYNITEKFVFGFIGSFSVWHGIETIAQMIPKIIKRYPQAHFLLIGSGPLVPFLKDSLQKSGIGSDGVTLTGTVAQEESQDYLSACDVFLSPTLPNSDGSRFFGSPTKMFEYMSLAKPIIASDLEQLSELLDDGAGILVKPGYVQAFVDAACDLVIMNEEKRKNFGMRVRQKAIKNYTWYEHTKKIIKSIV
ncbi:glycosyltransferase family 4 protein [bacterium]|nr:glycosyltransferase family 4 protein [bacterium]